MRSISFFVSIAVTSFFGACESPDEIENIDTANEAVEWYDCDTIATSLGVPDYYTHPEVFDTLAGTAVFTRNYSPGDTLAFDLNLWTSRNCGPVRNHGFVFIWALTAPRTVFEEIVASNPSFHAEVDGEMVSLNTISEPYHWETEAYGGVEDIISGSIRFDAMWGASWLDYREIVPDRVDTIRFLYDDSDTLPVDVDIWMGVHVQSTVPGLNEDGDLAWYDMAPLSFVHPFYIWEGGNPNE